MKQVAYIAVIIISMMISPLLSNGAYAQSACNPITTNLTCPATWKVLSDGSRIYSCDLNNELDSTQRHQVVNGLRNDARFTGTQNLASYNDSVCRTTITNNPPARENLPVEDTACNCSNPAQPSTIQPQSPPTGVTTPTANVPTVATPSGGGINWGNVAAGAAGAGVIAYGLHELGLFSDSNANQVTVYGQGTNGNTTTGSIYQQLPGTGLQLLALNSQQVGVSYKKGLTVLGAPTTVTTNVGYGTMKAKGTYTLNQPERIGRPVVETLIDESKSGFAGGIEIQSDVVRLGNIRGTLIAGADMNTYKALNEGTAYGGKLAARATAPIGKNLAVYGQAGVEHEEGLVHYDLGTVPVVEAGLALAAPVGDKWLLTGKAFGGKKFGTQTSDFVNTKSANFFGGEVIITQPEGNWGLGLSAHVAPSRIVKTFDQPGDTFKAYTANEKSFKVTVLRNF